ncbi:hypothetical protein [Aquabacterium humicola]|uniref:hypothetical protein n=1 Tax=Aquabacterium humicola TaxID=3237377 RepID=UPI002543D262|nr:hypothetical protein [Rubrivivax pictus]
MQALLAITIIVGFFGGIALLAVLGIRRARSMSKQHITDLKAKGQADRLIQPKTTKDHLLRPMSLLDVALAIGGAILMGKLLHVLLASFNQ